MITAIKMRENLMGLLPKRCSLVVVTLPLFTINLYGRD
jgi:hypothetical protein